MKRLIIVAGLTTLLASPAAAQFLGMPVWNSPKGGTGITVSGDYGAPDNADGGGSAFGGRASIGFSKFTLYAGATSWDREGASTVSSFGGGAAFRIIGGSLVPVAVNLFAGAATTSDIADGLTSAVAGAGVSASLPIPGFSLEPYANVHNRWGITDSDTETGLGATFGVNLTMGLFGAHLAYDTFSIDDVSRSVFGIGVHVSLKSPI